MTTIENVMLDGYKLTWISEEIEKTVSDVFEDETFRAEASLDGEPSSVNTIVDALTRDNRYLIGYNFLVNHNDDVIGVVGATTLVRRSAAFNLISKDMPNRKAFKSHDAVAVSISIRPGFQGKGHGTRLLQSFTAWLKNNWERLPVSEGYNPLPKPAYIFAQIWVQNARSIRLFERCGFVKQETADADAKPVLLAMKLV